ncbi:AraC family transcriptional regulator [Pseudomonas sp. GD03842]|uniref:AraC family transcriptional regulator n=1 Tax=Pseudomonas sp. GD03842 TaxID=2975385 RepID=UPI00244A6AB5|nr:AraC family transcriptional regulator [Pseudomonas sp. GD03842]MDH0746826.1 AraC family transcriptional regulator [Pseudomonas sp. GD03842]
MNTRRQRPSSSTPERVPAHQVPDYFPASVRLPIGQSVSPQVQVQLFRHLSTRQSLTVPAVAEPLLVLVLSGTAVVEERVGNEPWTANAVAADDFFLTMSPVPYEMRWQTGSAEGFEVIHLYLGQDLLELAARDLGAGHGRATKLREVSGERDPEVSRCVTSIHREMTSARPASGLYLHSVAQALAVHLVRRYRTTDQPRDPTNALPAYKLHRAVATMQAGLDRAFSLDRLATEAGMSVSHFSRMFSKATGQSPSRYFIHLRMDAARQQLLASDLSILDIALNVGYASPSHFAQVFKRHTGLTPREYRQGV